MATTGADFDSPWKAALERYLPDFLAFFFPVAAADIDWRQGYVFLDGELQKIVRDAKLGRRLADKLVQVARHDGSETWVLIHIEVQNRRERDFARRMFIYYTRILDRFNQHVVSLAVLGDQGSGWRPDQFNLELWGCALSFRFPIVKLSDYRRFRTELEANGNPFATVVLAHLSAQETRKHPGRRRVAKVALTRRLYELGYERADILELFRFIDWLLQLPADLEAAFDAELRQYEEGIGVSYITSIERRGIAQGIAVALDGIALALELKYGAEGQAVLEEISANASLELLQELPAQIKAASSVDELRAMYHSKLPPPENIGNNSQND